MKSAGVWLQRSCFIAALLGGGCTPTPRAVPERPPPRVTVLRPQSRAIVDYREFTGQTTAVEAVKIRARVSGYLDKINFKEGSDVQAGEVLFEIDPRPYRTALAQAQANVVGTKAKLRNLETDLARIERLVGDNVVTQETLDQAMTDRNEAAAALAAQKAAVEAAQLDLQFAAVKSPISGRTSNARLTLGNLVTADVTILTTVVSIEPMYAYFDVDESSALHYRELVRKRKVKSAREAKIPVHLALADEQGFPHHGWVDFVDNQSDPSSGNIRVRGIFANEDQVLLPGLFARLRVPFSEPHTALLVPRQALGMDQRGRYLLVAGDDDLVEYRQVKVGETHDAMVEINDGITADDRVIVRGVQQAQPGKQVQVTQAEATTASGETP